ncbi:hypothetical protein GGS26DRAFT_186872 [Hypomontagnella submonticulosa]|nr:hypothetical protein GGS26DRAFT_186872 [Hypomontagnella submonticulosa]
MDVAFRPTHLFAIGLPFSLLGPYVPYVLRCPRLTNAGGQYEAVYIQSLFSTLSVILIPLKIIYIFAGEMEKMSSLSINSNYSIHVGSVCTVPMRPQVVREWLVVALCCNNKHISLCER